VVRHKVLTLRRNFSWAFAGHVLYGTAQWGMLVVFAKLGTPEMLGQFALGLAVVSPVITLTNLQLQQVQATDARQQYQFGDYLALRLITTPLAIVVILGIVFITDYRWETVLVILLVGLARAAESVSDVFYGLLQQRERMDRVAKSMVIKGLLSLIALSLGVYYLGSVVWGAVGLLFAWTLVLLAYDIWSGAVVLQDLPQGRPRLTSRKALLSKLQPRWQIKTLKELVRLALPLGVVAALVLLNTNIPRYFIERYLGEWELGIFAALAYIMVAGLLVLLAIAQAVSPRLAKHYVARNGRQFSMLLLRMLFVAVSLGLIGVLIALIAGQEILALLYGPEYAVYWDVFLWLMVAAAINYIGAILGVGMTAARYFGVQVPLYFSVVCSCAAACLWLVPAAGLRGAATALIIAAVVQLGGSLAVVAYILFSLHGQKSDDVSND